MSEDLKVEGGTREERYRSLLPQIEGLLAGETDLTANMANFCAALKHGLGFFWVGFYLVKGDELVLGPFQGPVACTRIRRGRGVCGRCWETGRTVVVEDVTRFPGHIACSALSRSEIVVPLKDADGRVTAVLDVDHDTPGAFGPADERWLTELLAPLEGGGAR